MGLTWVKFADSSAERKFILIFDVFGASARALRVRFAGGSEDEAVAESGRTGVEMK